MIGLALKWAARNPLVTALAILALMFAGLAGYQKLANLALEVKLGQAENKVEELRLGVAEHKAARTRLSGALQAQTAEVERWQAEAEKRREAAARAAEAAARDFAAAQSRIAILRSIPPGSCSETMPAVREALGV